MAVNLVGTSNAKIDFGDQADIAGLMTMSFALTVKLTAAPSTPKRFFGQWGATGPKLAFLIFVNDTDELEFITSNGGGSFYGRKTTALNMVNGSQYRILITHDANGGATTHLYVNGTDMALASDGSGNTALGNATSTLAAGYESDAALQGQTCDISEIAIWKRVLSADEITAYFQGYSAAFFRSYGLHYWPLLDTAHLTDQWGTAHGTNTAGTDATHPTVITPTSLILDNLTEFGLRVDSTAAAVRTTQAYVELLTGDTMTVIPATGGIWMGDGGGNPWIE